MFNLWGRLFLINEQHWGRGEETSRNWKPHNSYSAAQQLMDCGLVSICRPVWEAVTQVIPLLSTLTRIDSPGLDRQPFSALPADVRDWTWKTGTFTEQWPLCTSDHLFKTGRWLRLHTNLPHKLTKISSIWKKYNHGSNLTVTMRFEETHEKCFFRFLQA